MKNTLVFKKMTVYTNGVNLYFIRDDIFEILKQKNIIFKHTADSIDKLKILYENAKNENSENLYNTIKYRAGFKNIDPKLQSGEYYYKYLKSIKNPKIYSYLSNKQHTSYADYIKELTNYYSNYLWITTDNYNDLLISSKDANDFLLNY